MISSLHPRAPAARDKMTWTLSKAHFPLLTHGMMYVLETHASDILSKLGDTRSNLSQNMGPGGTITNSSQPFQGSGYTNYNAPTNEEDTEPIRQWREKRNQDLSRRDEASQNKKQEVVSTAQKDIDSFYESYNRKADKQKAQTAKESEEFLAKREDTTAGGTSWERIAKLVDLSGKGQQGGGDGSSKKKMREILMSLKGDKDAPGAGGI